MDILTLAIVGETMRSIPRLAKLRSITAFQEAFDRNFFTLHPPFLVPHVLDVANDFQA